MTFAISINSLLEFVQLCFCISNCIQECQGLRWCYCQLHEAGWCPETDRIVSLLLDKHHRCHLFVLHCVSKKISNIFDCNFKTNYQIL